MTVIRRDEAPVEVVDDALGASEARLCSDAGGLTQFGAFVETLAPGARSSDRHWHEAEDEMAYVLSGEVTLVEGPMDGPVTETVLRPGDAATWRAGDPTAHCLRNASGAPASCLIVGTRAADDRVHYADLDKVSTKRGGVVTRTRRDGSPLEAGNDVP